MKYRPEIDGLRSLAVIPVVLFHAGFMSFSGGFIGVDIFFVISGYLIARIIIDEMGEQKFSYAAFYERRIRRILPALSVVVISSIIASLVFALPEQLERAVVSGNLAMLGVSNIYFWTQSGYFAPASEFQMLLHTWSLGVEERFYLFLPLFLYLIQRFGLNLRVFLASALPVMFVIGLWLSLNKPSVAFYLLPARAWELSIGVALAAGVVPRLKSAKADSLIAIFGLVAIALSVFVIDNRMPFPGWVALMPCVGTAAVIYSASSENVAGRFLGLPPLRFIGLISYSLYLWHWPVFVSLRMYSAEPHLDLKTTLFGVVFSLLLAFLTWKYIENPFRSKSTMVFRRVVLWLGAFGLASVTIGVIAIGTDGIPQRLDESTTARFASASRDVDPLRIRCSGMHELNDPRCRFGVLDSELSFVVVGDSHAGAIRPAIEEWAISARRSGTILWEGGCPLIIGAIRIPDADAQECSAFRELAVDAILTEQNIDTVFVVGRWEPALTGISVEAGGSVRSYLVDEKESQLTAGVTNRVFERGLIRTAQLFVRAGKKVVFIGAVPEVGFDVPTILALEAHNQGVSASRGIVRDNSGSVQLDAVFESIAKANTNISYVSIWRKFCDPKCRILMNGIPLFSDNDHLSLTGARDFLGPYLREEINVALSGQKLVSFGKVSDM